MSKYTVIIKTTGMGKGDQSLVDTLMKGFIHTLAIKENVPEYIILYAEGVKLTCTGSEAIDDFKILEEKGVKILSCGICLDYYELKDELLVGKVTTMGEVVDIISNTAYVVEP